MSAPLPGHGLVAEGRVWIPGHPVRNGTGPATCGCGAMSEPLPSTRQRKQWHRDHKQQIRTTETSPSDGAS